MAEPQPTCYRFAGFVLSPARRSLSKGGRDVPLIPRYFDLLVLLVEQRQRAVHRQEIFDRVWADVVVSDGALTQAIRTIRRVLDDDPQGGGPRGPLRAGRRSEGKKRPRNQDTDHSHNHPRRDINPTPSRSGSRFPVPDKLIWAFRTPTP